MTSSLPKPINSSIRPVNARRPKNIVLLSDGTGNSGGKGYGTNVWRMYNAVDLNGHIENPELPRQVVYYDDGVGTEDFKLWKLLGGAFGYGLSRNIRELYAFLVKNYQPGDNVYIFGFSRGAFTARSLAGLICRCGIADIHRQLTPEQQRTILSDASLIRLLGFLYHCVLRRNKDARLSRTETTNTLIMAAFRRYRREHFKNRPFWPAWVRGLLRGLSDLFLKGFGAYSKTDSAAEFQQAFSFKETRIRCVGVWDTVGALGAPSAEIRWALDQILRTDFHSQDLHPSVEYGYHALAVDDTRLTFHPVLWNEREGRKREPGSIEQVWFAGAHSNVGGGYPKQGMAHVSLLWMMRKVQKLGLRFDERAEPGVADRANVTDKLYNPRSGAGAYYRYRPRDIDHYARAMCAGPAKIHASVFHRIASGVDDYAPFNLPAEFEVVDDAGAQTGDAWRKNVREVIAGSDIAELKPRVARMVAWRRVIYGAMWCCTVLLGLGLISSAFVLGSAMFWYWTLPNPPEPQQLVAFAARTRELADLLVPISFRGLFARPAEFVGSYPYNLPLITLGLLYLYIVRSRLEERMHAPFIEFWTKLRMKLLAEPDEPPARAPEKPPSSRASWEPSSRRVVTPA